MSTIPSTSNKAVYLWAVYNGWPMRWRGEKPVPLLTAEIKAHWDRCKKL